MPRDLTSQMLTALSASMLYPAIFVELTFATSTAYMWSGVGSISWNSQTWIGLGSFLGFTTAEDSSTVEAKGITVTVSAFDVALLPAALTEFQLGLPALVYLGLFTDATLTVLVDRPIAAWVGRMDQPTVTIGGTEGTIAINCESRLLDMNISVERRYTQEDQGSEFPGDLGFSFVDSIQSKNLFWAQQPLSTNNI